MRDFDTEHYYINLDLKPALDEEKLDRRLLRDFEENPNRDFHNVLEGLAPRLMVPVLVERTGIPAAEKVHSVTKAQRRRLLEVLVPAHRHTGAPPGGGGHRHLRRDKGIRDQSHHFESKKAPASILPGRCWTWMPIPAASICKLPGPPATPLERPPHKT